MLKKTSSDSYRLLTPVLSSRNRTAEIERITKLINDHPFPNNPIQPILTKHIPLSSLSPPLVSQVLGRLFAAHSNGLKALEFFNYSLKSSPPTPDSFEKTLHILSRMRYFDQAWSFISETRNTYPNLLTLKSMSILLCKVARFGSYEETLTAFARLEKEIFKKKFGVDEFNVLLRAFCTEREMKEARSVFEKLHYRFNPDVKTMNILLLGFKEAGDVTATELFYHEMVKRGFRPNSVTYGIRIDGFCKKRNFGEALRLFEEMDRGEIEPTLQILTTLIHGAGVARNKIKARQLFDEIPERGFAYDCGAYNAFMSALMRCRDVSGAMLVMKEMEEKGIEPDSVTFHSMFIGMMKCKEFGFDAVCELYYKMKGRCLVPKTPTVVMLMKLFCLNGEVNLGLDLWKYMLEKGYCPHGHALELLTTALCARRRANDAFECSRQTVERGRCVSEPVLRMLETSLSSTDELEKLEELKRKMQKLHSYLPPPGTQLLS
ncbi:unnamed protein product [Eruca vesicaria subsp. sativa]|uniref:Pentatricopeptide repeat-containing protein n=1 Tax=Eruca vesicaria subsp. sativa TaxID=29727 RepID=A0ABC8M017_ERUVS|nr:unnamed protein product [Eruca vesicaria subsp. sativa]